LQNLNEINQPVIILVRPQLGENIGMCARAMFNCGITELRIVSPRDGWPSDSAKSASTGAIKVIENAKIFDNIKDALADLSYVVATTARNRDIAKEVYDIKKSTGIIREKESMNIKCGIIFGPERTGLENDDLCFANSILNIPLNPEFSSLNLAQAVLLVCFEWLNHDNFFKKEYEMSELADKGEVENLVTHLEDELNNSDFFRSPGHKPNILKNLRSFFFRATPTKQEIQTLRGIIKSISKSK